MSASTTDKKGVYSPLHQFDISAIKLYREGWADNEKYDIRDMMFEFIIYEDIFQGTISAALTLADYANVVDNFPIVGAERIDIFFKTPTNEEEQKLSFAVAKISHRMAEQDNSDFTVETLHLVTPERMIEADYVSSRHYEGTYTEIVKKLIGGLVFDDDAASGKMKEVISDESLYVQQFINPYWTNIKCCEHIAKRAMGDKFEPFLFFENLDGYNFRSVKKIVDQEPYATYKIENGRVASDAEDYNRKFRRVLKYEMGESGDRMRQREEMGFAGSIHFLDTTLVRNALDSKNYTEMSKSPDYAKVDKFPMFSGWPNIKRGISLAREDKSHEGFFYRKFYFGLIDNFRLKILVPGDSNLRVGQIIQLDIPDKSVSRYQKEQMTSGRWLIASLKHIIKREAYSVVLELVKDSHEVNIIRKAEDGDLAYDETRIPTGNASPAPAGAVIDED
jgi:hypothetical protein